LPYSLTSGNLVDFQARESDSLLADYLPFDFEATDVDKPTYSKNIEGIDHVFHFNTIRFFNRIPQTLFTLRVTILRDATLLGFRVPHHFSDGQSIYDIIKGYCDLVSDRPIPTVTLPPAITTPLSACVQGEDSLPASVSSESAPFVDAAENFAIGTIAVVKYVWNWLSRDIAAKLGFGDKTEERYIHLPGKLVQQWRNDCQKELEQLAKDGALTEGAGIELTKNDVIAAWFLKVML
jgi:hypothetical protein